MRPSFPVPGYGARADSEKIGYLSGGEKNLLHFHSLELAPRFLSDIEQVMCHL